jgi:fucose permease
VLTLCTAAFFWFGVCLVLVGANQAEIAGALDLDLAQSGMLGAALAGGIGVGVVGAGPLFDRQPRRPLFVASTALAGLALLTVDATAGFPQLLVSLALAGLGLGAYDTFINALVVERFGAAAPRPMAIVHAGATAGAIAGPLAVEWLAAGHPWSRSFQGAGLAHLVLAAAACTARFPAPPRRADPGDTGASPAGLTAVLRSPSLLPFAAVAFAYVGVEGALTLFAVPYVGDAGNLPESLGRTTISALWAGLLVGRLASAPVVAGRGREVLLLAGPLAAAVIGAGVLAGAGLAAATFGLAGLCLGCVYPVMISLAGHRFPGAPGTAAGLAAGAGAVGGFAIPWLTGAVGDAAGIAAAVATLACWCAAIGVAAAAISRPEHYPS